MFKNLKFRTKLIITLLLPTVALLFFSIGNVSEKSNISTEMSRIQKITNLSVYISALVHESQKERGRTAGFLGSKGTKFVSELPAQRLDTDKKINELNKFLSNFDRDLFDNKFNRLIEGAMRMLNGIGEKRNDIIKLKINGSRAIKYYTEMNTAFLNIIAYTTKLSTNTDITVRLFAFVNFLQAKERAGIERALLSNTFVKNKFDRGIDQKVAALIALQNAFIDSFLKTATKEAISFYNELMKDKSIAEVERIRKVALDRVVEGNFGIDASYWFNTITSKINQLKRIDDNLAKSLNEYAGQLKNKSRTALFIIILITALILISVIFLSFIVVRDILNQLGGEPKEVIEMTRKIVNGDLTNTINRKQKTNIGIYGMMVEMTEKLTLIVGDVKSAAGNVAQGSDELSSSAQVLAQGATEQASAAEELASAMEEMGANIQQNTDNSQQTEKISTKASLNAKESGKAVIEATTAMKIISEKINIIQEIARQTNLLALNAAIEAARAGEHGKGFAVVASEVRKLAERSQNAAEEITELAKNSLNVADKAGDMLNLLVPDIEKTADLVSEITASSIEQNQGAAQINKAISELDKVVQQNAGSSEEMASTAEELSSQAQVLQSTISFFKTDD